MCPPMADALQLSSTDVDGGHRVTVSGEVDMATAPQLAEYLVQFAGGDVHVDLSAVTFLDSSGLSALVASQKRIERSGGQLVIHGTSPLVDHVIEVTGLDHYLHVDADVPDGGPRDVEGVTEPPPPPQSRWSRRQARGRWHGRRGGCGGCAASGGSAPRTPTPSRA